MVYAVHPSRALADYPVLDVFLCSKSVAAQLHIRGMHANEFLDLIVLACASRPLPSRFTLRSVLCSSVLYNGFVPEGEAAEARQQWLCIRTTHE